MKRPRIYADTSVYGGCFDDEFAETSRRFFEEVGAGRFILVVSETVAYELRSAPSEVAALLGAVPEDSYEAVVVDEEVEQLRDAYLSAGVVGRGSLADAEHIASASVAGVDAIVSWNFKHVVHFEKIRGYHSVNIREGYVAVPIHTPMEVINTHFRQGGQHRFSYDFETLRLLLQRSGFREIQERSYQDSRLEELAIDAPWHQTESLYVEAISPEAGAAVAPPRLTEDVASR